MKDGTAVDKGHWIIINNIGSLNEKEKKWKEHIDKGEKIIHITNLTGTKVFFLCFYKLAPWTMLGDFLRNNVQLEVLNG